MQYVIVQNRTTILLGPIDWKPRFIQSEFKDLEIDYVVPLGEPPGYVNVDQEIGGGSSTGIEIFPILGSTAPNIDPVYQAYAGPFWSYDNQSASLAYTAVDKNIDEIKATLLNLTADERWKKEIAGTTIDIDGTSYTLFTDRNLRSQYTELLNTIGTSIVNWKFPQGFVQVDRVLAQQMLETVVAYVQAQFDWEALIRQQIQAAQTIDDLKAVVIVEPLPTPQNLFPQINNIGAP